jgi:hypothetical protein
VPETRLDLLRPPPHRGPLIAAGAVVLAVGVMLAELRLGGAVGVAVHLLITGVTAGVILGIGLQPAGEGGRPPAYQSVLLVTGLLVFEAFLLRLADLLGADFGAGGGGARNTFVWGNLPPGAMVWTSVVLSAVAGWAALARRSAVCLLIAALAAGLALTAAVAWIFDADTQGPYRFLLLVCAIGLALGSLQLLSLFGGSPESLLPDFWEFVVLAAGCGLIAYGAVDRVPGAAYLGLANLVLFVAVTAIGADATLLYWPLGLILLGGGALLAGLRPRAPLPPEPDPYRAGEQPLAARADEEITLRVRDDSPPG